MIDNSYAQISLEYPQALVTARVLHLYFTQCAAVIAHSSVIKVAPQTASLLSEFFMYMNT